MDLTEHDPSVVLGVAEHVPTPAAAHHLAGQGPVQQAVAERSGLGVGLDHVDHLAQVREVADRVDAVACGVAQVLALGVEVADVVGHHGDARGREVGLGHEDVVLQATPPAREPQTLLVQERPAQHLVRRQAVQQRVLLQRRVQPGPVPHGHADGTAEALGLADHDVGVGLLGLRVLPFQGLHPEHVVLVDELDVLPGRGLDAVVARSPRPARVLPVDDVHVRVLGRQPVQPGRRLVGRPVVDEDQLQLIGRHRLRQQRLDARLDVPPRVVDRDHHAHLDGPAGRSVRRRTGRGSHGWASPWRSDRVNSPRRR